MTEPITKAAALEVFDGNQAALARALGIKQQAVQQWDEGPIPELRQYQLRAQFPDLFGDQPKAA